MHFGHKNIKKFEPTLRSGEDHLENMEIIIDNWNRVVTKRDIVYVLGDVAFTNNGYDSLGRLKGEKRMIRGNHDNYFTTEQWLKYFTTIEGLVRYKGYWLSHAPVHPNELRGRKSIHGHVHSSSIRLENGEYDERYINVCCEPLGETPVPFDKIKSGEYYKMRKC